MSNNSTTQNQLPGNQETDGVPVVEEQDSGLLNEYHVLPSPSAVPSGGRRPRRTSRTQCTRSEKLSSELSHRLRDASAILLDRLFDYLSKCPAPSDEANEPLLSTRTPKQHLQRGLTLPASAIGWLSLHLYTDGGQLCDDERDGQEEDEQDWWMEVPTRDRLPLIKFLLPRATHLRVTSDEWPPPPPSKSKIKKKKKNSVNKRLAQASLEENQPFLRYFYLLRHHPRVDMRVFPNLSVLLLDGIPPEWITNMNVVQEKLELLRMERGCIYNLTSFLFPKTTVSLKDPNGHEDESVSYVELDGFTSVYDMKESQDLAFYQKLTHLKLSHCAIGELSGLLGQQLEQNAILNDDESLASEARNLENGQDGGSGLILPQTKKCLSPPPLSLLPNLVSLSLAHNELVRTSTALAGLSSLPFLSKLDLSFNQLSRMDDAFLMLGNVKVLLLSGNRIESARGLDRLYSLEHLALDHNNIQDLADVAGLARLPELSTLDLYGNKLVEKNPEKYRIDVLNIFRESRFSSLAKNATYRQLLQILPILDGKCATKRELVALRYLTFTQNISNPIHSNEPLVIPVEENEGEKEGEDESWSLQNESDPLEVSSPAPEPTVIVPLTAPQSRGRRITRRTKTRRAVIGDGFPTQTPLPEKMRKGRRSLIAGRGDLLNFQQIHSSLQSELTAEKSDYTPKVRKVNFSVQDVISSLPVASTSALRFDELADEDSTHSQMEESSHSEHFVAKIEEADLPPASEIVSTHRAPDAELDGDALSDTSPRRDTSSTTVADLSLLSISTVKLTEESLNGYTDRKESRLAEDEADYEAEGGVAHEEEGGVAKEEEGGVANKEEGGVARGEEGGIANGVYERTDSQGDSLPSTPQRELEKIFDKEHFINGAESHTETISDARNGSSVATSKSRESTKDDEKVEQLILKQASFPEHIWDDDISVPSSLGTNRDDVAAKLKYRAAEETSLYDGPESYRGLNVLVNLELYFRCFVFPSSGATVQQPWYGDMDDDDKSSGALRVMPRIQLCNADRKVQRKSDAFQSREGFRHVWSEEIVACGKSAASRLAPNRTPRRGFHGDIVFAQGKLATVSECRKLIFCSSDAALYLISDYDAVTSQSPRRLKKRQFPMPMPQDALFENAPWPHAVARHPIRTLHRITIGFGFQRLTLHFTAAYSGAQDFIYVLLTSNKLTTISLLQQLQDHVKDATSAGITEVVDDAVTIDNDDKQFLDALAAAVSPTVVGIVLHYQVLQQRWKHGDRGSVRRACVVTDTGLFLLDEDYVGDGSTGSYELDGKMGLGDVSLKVVESAELHEIVEVLGADADPRSITIVVRPSSRLKRTHRWRLLCRDGDGAERLVEDVRKAI